MNLRKLLLVSAFSVATGTIVRSASPIDAELPAGATLEQAIAFALANNPGIRAAEARWRAAIAKVPQARGWPDPKLNYGYFAESVETRVGPQEHRIGVMQPLPWFGKLRAAGDVAGADAAAVLADFVAAQLEVVRDVKSAWFELAWLNEAQRITADNIQLVKQLEAVAQTRLRAGGDLGAVTKAQVELGQLEDRFASLDDLREPLGARLNAVLNRPSAAPLPAILGVRTNNVTLPSLSDLAARQMDFNPMLDQLAQRIRREEHATRLARKAGMPEFGLGVDYIVTGEARMPGVADSGKDAVVAMFTINLPLWRKKYESAVVEAEERRQAAESSRLDRANELAAGLKMAHYRFRDAERKINLYGATLLPQARGAMNVARRNYESGEGQFLDLIDAQRVQLDLELEYQRALVGREQAVAEIELLVGGLPELPASSPTGSAPSPNTP